MTEWQQILISIIFICSLTIYPLGLGVFFLRKQNNFKNSDILWISDEDKKLHKLMEDYPDDDAEMPLNKDGSIDYKAVKNLPKNTREEKIIYCALCNRVFGTHIFVTFSKLSDKQLQNNVEAYEYMWPEDY